MPHKPNRLTILLDRYCPPTTNEAYRAVHWSSLRKARKECCKRIYIACLEQHRGVPKVTGPVAVRVTRLRGKGQRELEMENLHLILKPILDALRASKMIVQKGRKYTVGGLGIIEDDTPALCKRFVRDRKNPSGVLQTLIEIRPLPLEKPPHVPTTARANTTNAPRRRPRRAEGLGRSP
ncbi:MAG: hypothetical protein IT442_04965 [Phycisphaeraceae bacterium]|nr:hypothetical protein [Phycisphaeraceae bacterium]